jgi:arylsulfatase A-like enzyme
MGGRPDVLWLSLESVRADHTSLHGYARETTPNLRRMSSRGDATVLDPVVAASMWTPASTASMLTGTHMSTHQVGQDGKCEKKLPQSIETLPERLRASGYSTALFSPTYYIGPETGLDRGFAHVESITVDKGNFVGYDSLARDSVSCALRCLLDYPTTDLAALKREISNSKNSVLFRRFRRWSTEQSNAPFFAYAHVPSPHHPYHPPARFREAFAADLDMTPEAAKRLSREVYTGTEGIRRLMASGLDLTEAQWEAITAMYDAAIRYADQTVDRLVSAARACSDRPLVVVVTGDHGDLFGESGLIGHNLVLHDGLTRVPGLVVGVDGVVDTPETVTQHVDLTRTVAAVTDVATDQFCGRDLRDGTRPYAISQRGVAHLDEYTTYDSSFDTSRFFERPFTAVRTPAWKYLENDERAVLYDLPDETTNVRQNHPEIAEDLSAVIDDEGIDWDAAHDAGAVEFDETAKDRLEDLGYLT